MIPKIIWQTWKTKTNLFPSMQNAINSIKELNPEYEHRLFDDTDCDEYIKKHFPVSVLKAYRILGPGAYKADIWRYCVLIKEGGVYFDIDFVAYVSLREILQPSDQFVSVKDREYQGPHAVFQAFIACPSNLEVMKTILNLVVDTVLKREARRSGLDYTGPVAFGRGVNKYRNKPENHPLHLGVNILQDSSENLRLLSHENDSTVRETKNGKLLFLTKYPEYESDGGQQYEHKPVYQSDYKSILLRIEADSNLDSNQTSNTNDIISENTQSDGLRSENRGDITNDQIVVITVLSFFLLLALIVLVWIAVKMIKQKKQSFYVSYVSQRNLLT